VVLEQAADLAAVHLAVADLEDLEEEVSVVADLEEVGRVGILDL
jgi:hypothetical protein